MTAQILLLIAAIGLVVLAGTRVVRARLRWRWMLRSARHVEKSHEDRAEAVGDAATEGVGATLRRTSTRMLGSGGGLAVVAAVAAAVGGAFGIGVVLGGPVAGGVLGCYAGVAVIALRRRQRTQLESRSRAAAVDAVAGLAAELRAGVAVAPALASMESALDGFGDGAGAEAITARLRAAVDLAESSGAPLADVLDRLDSHLRAAERARATAQAQAAGALASATLLAVMPVAGAGLGFLVGIDPATVLLHTPIGAACLCGAVVLQLAGLAWSARLSRVEVAS